MKLMNACDCSGLIPAGLTSCPHCGAAVTQTMVRRWAKRLASVAGGAGLAMTLMACYGQPPCDDLIDADADGFFVCAPDSFGFVANPDCNDADATTFPGADDPEGDGIDQDCDGVDGVFTPAEPDAGPDDAGTSDAG